MASNRYKPPREGIIRLSCSHSVEADERLFPIDMQLQCRSLIPCHLHQPPFPKYTFIIKWQCSRCQSLFFSTNALTHSSHTHAFRRSSAGIAPAAPAERSASCTSIRYEAARPHTRNDWAVRITDSVEDRLERYSYVLYTCFGMKFVRR